MTSSSDKRWLLFHWTMSSFFGWGVYGINLALQWAADPEIGALCCVPVADRLIQIDPLRRRILAPLLDRSQRMVQDFVQMPKQPIRVDRPVMRALGDRLTVTDSPDYQIQSRQQIGIVFTCNTIIGPEEKRRAEAFDVIIAGSSWNHRLLSENGIDPVRTVIQGIDPTLFHPAPRSGLLANRFVVFSGGKLEYRKGQDVVLRAFRAFYQRHPDALLITAWHSPWPQFSEQVTARGGLVPFQLTADGQADVSGWLRANGLPDHAFVDLGTVPNNQLPPILREADLAVFPNRCEPGTNLVAMECMACGVPVALSANTGHLDLIADDRCFPLRRQSPSPPIEADGQPYGAEGWGESSAEELLAVMEAAYAQPERARAIGNAGARFIQQFTWANQMTELKETLRPWVLG